MSGAQARQLSFPWTSSAAGSHAKTSAALALAVDSAANDPASGTSSRASLESCDPPPSSSRTSEAAHGSGCARSGRACTNSAIEAAPWRLPRGMLARLIVEPASSSLRPTLTATANLLCPSMQKWPAHRRLLPTLTATPYGSNKGGAAGRTGEARPSLDTLAGSALSPTWCEWFQGFPIGWTDVEP